MRASELVLVTSICVFSAVLALQSLEFRYFAAQGFGPGFVPLSFAIVTLGIGLTLVLKGLDADALASLRREVGHRLRAAGPAMLAIALLFAATALMAFGSVLAPIFVAMVAISLTLAGHSLVKALWVNAATLAVVYAIFNLWLNIPVT